MGLEMLIDVLPPIPPELNESYVPFGYWNFGCMCWQYEPQILGIDLGLIFQGGYDGAIEWINTMHIMTAPKLPNPVGLRTYFKPGVLARITPFFNIDVSVPDLNLNGVPVNPSSGKGMPLLIE